MKFYLALFLSYFIIFVTYSQFAPGEWQDQSPYHRTIKVALSNDKVYCCTRNSIFYYDKLDNSLTTLSKIQGLTEVDVADISYYEKGGFLIIAYANANMDFIIKNKVVNFPYIKNKGTIIDKRINNINIVDDKAYVACNFGLVVINLNNLLVEDTYYPSEDGKGSSINGFTKDETYFYVATNKGIFRVENADPFLADYSHWKIVDGFSNYQTECSNVVSVNGKIYTLFKDNSLASNDSIIYLENNIWKRLNIVGNPKINSISTSKNRLLLTTDKKIFSVDGNNTVTELAQPYSAMYTLQDNEYLWAADFDEGMVRFDKSGNKQIFVPNSPYYAQSFCSDVANGNLWTVTGTISNGWQAQYNSNGIQAKLKGHWYWYNKFWVPAMERMGDFVNVKINPKDPDEVAFASYGYGVLIYNKGQFTQYNGSNSTLEKPNHRTEDLYITYGLAYDNNQNLWVTNADVTNSLHVRKKDGKWRSFALEGNINRYFLVGDVIVTSWGHKWIYIPKSVTINVFDDNETIDNESDDRQTTINLAGVESLISSSKINCLVEDREGVIWVGTDAGPILINSGQYVFEDGEISARKITVPYVKGQKESTFLLETENINSIAVDGNNRKWIGTLNSGAYLVQDNGNEVAHFTKENSPLLSNNVMHISIDQSTGDINFSTDKGLITYRGFATKGSDEFGDVHVFPNPVREDYTGNIIVTDLLQDADVRITDIAGNIVFQTKALGGQAVWDGTNYKGKRVNTGVYMVFCSNSDGTKTYITKLLFIH